MAKELLYRKFKRKAFAVNTFDTVLDSSGGTMRRSLTAFQLVLLGIGTMVGAGLFVATGVAAKEKAGPGIIIGYIIAGISCTLSALCYAEYACEFPIAGGAFNYITLTFGELAGWLVACQLFIEWTLANAAVAKGFSGYLANLFNIRASIFKVYSYDFVAPSASNSYMGFGIEIEWLSVVFLAVLTGIMLLGTKESALAQNVSVGIYLTVILLCIIAGATQVENSNYKPFLPYGAKGIFRGASSVFFSYIGFDMVASMAEETLHPNRDLPIGIIGSLSAATAIYVAMSAVLTGMISYANLDTAAPFAQAFRDNGMKWAGVVVALGAVVGCTNSEFGGLLGQSRIFVTMGRAGLLPSAIAKVDPKRSTPYWAIIVSGVIAAVLALLLNIDILTDFVSMGTLFAYMMVCIGVLWRRYYVKGETQPWVTGLLATLILEIVACGLVMGFCYNYDQPMIYYITPVFMFLTILVTFHFIPVKLASNTFHCPLVPIVPGCGIMINLLLIGSLNKYAYYFWLVWVALSITIYLAYGLHHTQGEGRASSDDSRTMEEKEMELATNIDRLGIAAQRAVLDHNSGVDANCMIDHDEGVKISTPTGYRPSSMNLFQRNSFT